MEPHKPHLGQVDLNFQFPRAAQLEGKGVAGPSQHLVRVSLVGHLCEGLTFTNHTSDDGKNCCSPCHGSKSKALGRQRVMEKGQPWQNTEVHIFELPAKQHGMS